MNRHKFVIFFKITIMEKQDNLNKKIEDECRTCIKDECDFDNMYCIDWCCYVRCGNKCYRVEYFDPLGTIDDEYIEFFEDDMCDKIPEMKK